MRLREVKSLCGGHQHQPILWLLRSARCPRQKAASEVGQDVPCLNSQSSSTHSPLECLGSNGAQRPHWVEPAATDRGLPALPPRHSTWPEEENLPSETTVRFQNHCSVLLHIPGQWHLILHSHPIPHPHPSLQPQLAEFGV